MIRRNMGRAWRLLYALIGVVLVAAPWLASLEGAVAIVVPVFGGLALVASATGW